jgi:two-component system OmpR family sensor kinase
MAVDELQPLAQQAGLTLQHQLDDTLEPVQGQADALGLLLRNLLENALRYTPAGGQVLCRWYADAECQRVLSVEDSGPGIAPEERERVLDRFYRVPGTTAHGSGLGLAIVSAVARQHGAQLLLDASPSLGGLRVRVIF